MLTKKMNDKYDRDALVTSMNKIRERSDNPLWFDGSRAVKTITNYISHKINEANKQLNTFIEALDLSLSRVKKQR